MKNILIDSYAVSPTWGSEPGMGWNWVCNLAKYCNLYIITEGEWQKEIECAIADAISGRKEKDINPTGLQKEQAERLHFYYLNVSPEIRKMCWNQGSWMFYKYYAEWELRVLDEAKKIIQELKNKGIQIDLVHKLNMIGYREPGYLWKISDRPFVWGPVGGYGGVPISYLRNADIKTKVVENLKNVINYFMFRLHPRVRKAMKQADAIVGAYKETYEAIRKVYREDAVLINETGAFVDSSSTVHSSDQEEFRLLWVGKYDLRKQLGIAIRTMELLKDKKNIHLYVVGTGYPADVALYTKMVEEKGLKENVHLMGLVPNLKTREMMKEMDLFFFTSIHDATSTVVPEAISAGLPVVCHDTRGFGVIVDNQIGRKIKVTNPETSAIEFADVIRSLESDREEVRRLSRGCIVKQKDISWGANAKKMVVQYEKAIQRFINRQKE